MGSGGCNQDRVPPSWVSADETSCGHGSGVPALCLSVESCRSSPEQTRQGADFPAAVTDLSGCTHQATHSMPSPYLFRLIARADQREFLITATGTSEQTLRSTLATPELHFMANGKTTRVEMRNVPSETLR